MTPCSTANALFDHAEPASDRRRLERGALSRPGAGAVVVDARDPQEFAAGHLAGRAERAGRRTLRRDRRNGPRAARTGRGGRRRAVTSGDRHPAGPDRLRPRRGLPPGSRGTPAPSIRPKLSMRVASPPPELSRLAAANQGPVILDVRNAGEREPVSSPARCTSRSPSCAAGSRRSRPTSQWSPTAREDGAPASPPASCGAAATRNVSDLLGGFAAWEAKRDGLASDPGDRPTYGVGDGWRPVPAGRRGSPSARRCGLDHAGTLRWALRAVAVAGLAPMAVAAITLGRGLTAAPLPNAHAQLGTRGLYGWSVTRSTAGCCCRRWPGRSRRAAWWRSLPRCLWWG